MEYYHITKDTADLIHSAGKAVGAIETGNRNCIRAEEAFWMNAYRSKGRYVKSLPRNYRILYSKMDNLGTRKYPDYVTRVYEVTVKSPEDIHETEKSIVFRKHTCISKDRVLCYVW